MVKIKHLSLINIVLSFFCLFLLVLFFRSFVFTTRIMSEFTTYVIRHKSKALYLPNVTACLSKNKITTREIEQLFNYRSLGVKCEK